MIRFKKIKAAFRAAMRELHKPEGHSPFISYCPDCLHVLESGGYCALCGWQPGMTPVALKGNRR